MTRMPAGCSPEARPRIRSSWGHAKPATSGRARKPRAPCVYRFTPLPILAPKVCSPISLHSLSPATISPRVTVTRDCAGSLFGKTPLLTGCSWVQRESRVVPARAFSIQAKATCEGGRTMKPPVEMDLDDLAVSLRARLCTHGLARVGPWSVVSTQLSEG